MKKVVSFCVAISVVSFVSIPGIALANSKNVSAPCTGGSIYNTRSPSNSYSYTSTTGCTEVGTAIVGSTATVPGNYVSASASGNYGQSVHVWVRNSQLGIFTLSY
jgi:hypothetical protein